MSEIGVLSLELGLIFGLLFVWFVIWSIRSGRR